MVRIAVHVLVMKIYREDYVDVSKSIEVIFFYRQQILSLTFTELRLPIFRLIVGTEDGPWPHKVFTSRYSNVNQIRTTSW